jgi:hypothetical protein
MWEKSVVGRWSAVVRGPSFGVRVSLFAGFLAPPIFPSVWAAQSELVLSMQYVQLKAAKKSRNRR